MKNELGVVERVAIFQEEATAQEKALRCLGSGTFEEQSEVGVAELSVWERVTRRQELKGRR